MANELKPCRMIDWGEFVTVECEVTELDASERQQFLNHMNSAITAWNRRAPQPSPDATEARLREIWAESGEMFRLGEQTPEQERDLFEALDAQGRQG